MLCRVFASHVKLEKNKWKYKKMLINALRINKYHTIYNVGT